MKTFYLLATMIILTCAGWNAGFSHGCKEGYVRGFSVGAASVPAVMVATGTTNPLKKVERVEDYWMYVEYEGRHFYYTKYASPKLMNELGDNETVYNYFYCYDGTYAFPVDVFSFEEIYELVLRQKAPTPKVNYGANAKFVQKTS